MNTFYRRLPQFEYARPRTIDEAITCLVRNRGHAKVFAGGTDLLPAMKGRTIDVPELLVDLKAIEGLDTISYDPQRGLTIGALATIDSIARSSLVRDHYPSLVEAALNIASPQIRNRGTFTGNICNAVPSADSAPPLMALGAVIRAKGPRGERTIPMDQFFTGPRVTILDPDEIVIDVRVPGRTLPGKETYIKLAPRHSMDLAVVGVAAMGATNDGICREIKIALGAVAPTPLRALKSEEHLKGNKITPEAIEETARIAGTECTPIDDHRASAEYRRDMVYVLTRRALKRVFLDGGRE